jgi:hypothetical protein
MEPQPAREKLADAIATTCQATSHLDEPCNALAITRCEACGLWLCADHAADDEWHACLIEDGETGGEG